MEGSIATLAHRDLEGMIAREERERALVKKLCEPNERSVRVKKDIFCGLCQTAVFCSYVVFDRRCDLNLSTDELYEVPEGFVDQGRGGFFLWDFPSHDKILSPWDLKSGKKSQKIP